jgi:arginyl-tRNA synthetase
LRRTTSLFTCVNWRPAYHSYYDAERILVDDEAVKLARLALVAATAQVLHNGLAVLGVSAPQKM